MGLHFGNLWKYYGMITYTISPFEQKALKGVINPGFLNTCRRIAENVPYMGPPALLSYLVYEWGEHENHLTHRKNPADYENDQ
ncbi:cytochrome b-c1 complex subunit 8 [Contarinia nasturtii]|uniref:cytochrome b-c1 complex subunit 8 n=1 Tax=Contarinia nasturtii TaxID=265458 RepID=UPI0012D492FB|nr:cytochrome b-c1 complex subunit 8 [Contarinia nasturtii]